VIIGAASGKVVSSLVDKVIMPPISLITGRVNFSELRVVLHPAVFVDGKETAKEVALGYGSALQSFIELLIVAFIVFMIVRMVQRMIKAAPPPGPSAQEVLLGEIRDLLKAQSSGSIAPKESK